jgi:hypothetical protein
MEITQYKCLGGRTTLLRIRDGLFFGVVGKMRWGKAVGETGIDTVPTFAFYGEALHPALPS